MMIAFIYRKLDEAANQFLADHLPAGISPVFRTELSKEKWRDAFLEADFVLGNPPREWFEPKPPKLAFWQIASAGFSEYEGMQAGLPVANMGDFFARPCAETMVGGIAALYRGIHTLTRLQDQKQWAGEKIRKNLRLLGDQRAIVLGAGAIGRLVKDMLRGFGCRVEMAARTNPAAQIHSREELLDALPETTLIVNTLPGSAEKYVTADVFTALPEGAVYASVGRGETTDEQALIQALQSGKLAGAVLDVTEVEPLPADSPLWQMENVILSQHTGGGQQAELTGIAQQFLANLEHYLHHEPLENAIELSRGY